MKNIFSITIAIVTITILGLLAGVFVSVNLDIQAAREFHSSVVERIQASYYSPYVIEECKAKAKGAGYQLEINDSAVYQDIHEYYVALEYKVKIPLLETSMGGKIEGYAK